MLSSVAVLQGSVPLFSLLRGLCTSLHLEHAFCLGDVEHKADAKREDIDDVVRVEGSSKSSSGSELHSRWYERRVWRGVV